MSEHSPFLNRLKGVFHRELQKERTPEQLQTLHRMREILEEENHPGMQLLHLTEAWYERMAAGLPREKVELLNSLYQKVAGSPEVSFSRDFPTIARRFVDSFRPQSNKVKDLREIDDFTLSPLERFDKYASEYLESLLPPQSTGEPRVPLLPPAQPTERTE